jgi:hypothetical protein
MVVYSMIVKILDVLKPQWQNCRNQKRLKPSPLDWLKLLLCVYALMVMAVTTTAAPILNTDNPVSFFTNVASRLLSTELNVSLTQIEIYPANQYTPAVHRLLQVSANIYDATSTNFYPARFRPLFTVDSAGNVFICGYEQQTNFMHQSNELDSGVNPDIAAPVNAADLLGLPANTVIETNVYGIPWVIGVKRGLPNFNEFTMESAVQVTRKLQFTRNINTIPASDFHTNQMYLMNITNFYGVECWNSYFDKSNYTSPYGSGPLDIVVRNVASMTLTNQSPYATPSTYSQTWLKTNWLAYTLDSWPSNLFVVPLNTSDSFFAFTIPVFVYRYNLFGSTSNFLDSGIYPLPQFGFVVTNHLQVVIIDYSGGADSGQIVDYVQLNDLTGIRNLTGEIADPTITGLWSTNFINNTGPIPSGVINQFYTSRIGRIPIEDLGDQNRWANTPVPGLPPGISTTIEAEQIYFSSFFSTRNTANYGGLFTITNRLSSMQAPLTITRLRVQRLTWQANDPLVHYLASDLVDLLDDANSLRVLDWPVNLGLLNNRYNPWGGNPAIPPNKKTPDNPATASAWNMALKDPLVSSSDNWDFPVGQSFDSNSHGNGHQLNLNSHEPKNPMDSGWHGLKHRLIPSWLGRVHRGTPWQTIYLKSTDVLQESNGTNLWMNWTGDFDINDAAAMAPVRDWHLASLLTSLMNQDNPASLFSINNPDTKAWQELLDGMIGSTNIPNQSDSVLISKNSEQASAIANAIQSVRINQSGQYFGNVGDILATAQLSEQSPFLAGVDTNIISDDIYEIIPSQLLPILRADSIGSVATRNRQPVVRFTGFDDNAYVIQVSSDLVNWVSVSTNSPVNGVISFTNSISPNANQQFYRSVLLQ